MSVFDPSSSLEYLVSGWLVLLVSFPILIKHKYWFSPSTGGFSLKFILESILTVFNINKVVFTSLFLFILVMNFMGLLPMVFSPTSHLTFNMILSLTLWLGLMIWYSWNNVVHLLSHLTPMGCPIVLVPFMVVIELVSSLIRPLTLSLRLMANVMAGHMILTLISKGVFTMSVFVSLPMFMILSGFLMFEFGVAVIQAYVFSSLMSLYWGESVESN